MQTTSLVLAALLLASPLLRAAQEGQDWPGWRGPERDGIAHETGWTATGQEKELWRAEVGRGYSCVAVVEGRLYTKGHDVEVGVDVVRCLDALTGEELWAHAYPAKLWDTMHEGGTLTTPVVDGGRVYVMSRLGKLLVLDARSGEVRAERVLVQDEKGLGTFGLSASPLVLDGRVYLNVGRTLALDAADAKTLWETKDYGYSYGVPVPFEVDGTALLAVFNGAGLAVLERKDGKERALFPWTSEYNVNSATPIVSGRRLFISTGYNAKGCALLEFTGKALEVVWQSKEMNNTMNGCVLVDGHYYGFDEAKLKCLDGQGRVKWEERGLGKGALLVSDGRLIVLSEEGELLIAPATPKGFEPLTRTKLFESGVCWTTPVLSRGILYCRSSTGTLVARDHRAAH